MSASFLICRSLILYSMVATLVLSQSLNGPLALAFSTPSGSSSFRKARAPDTPLSEQRIVLVGGGHAHVQVIKALNRASRPSRVHVTLIDVQKSASYSGMVPGCVSNLYKPEDTLLHLEPLTDWASIEFINDKVVDIDFESNLITLENNELPIPYDVVSIDIGSASRGLLDTKGARRYTIPTRPISDLVRRLEIESEELSKNPRPVNFLVIGGGVAGIELAMSVMGRWKTVVDKENILMTLLNSGSQLLPQETPANQRAVLDVLSERGIQVRHNCVVEEVGEAAVRLKTGEEIGFTHCLWATGAGAHDLAWRLQRRGLAVSDRGWIRVNKHLQSVSHPNVFAAGDCCVMEGLEKGSPPKAGVYAVRAGPILIQNLVNVINTEPLKPYVPQDDFMKLLACGDGTALGFRFGFPIRGKWVWQLKDAIDRKFMDLFKKENLPELKDGQPFDTSQYDAAHGARPPPREPKNAAALLQRSDDAVDFQEAWNVLRDMAENERYRMKVLECIDVTHETLAVS